MRRPILVLGLAAALAMLHGDTAARSADEREGRHDGHQAAFERCARSCNDCQRACDSCATHCANLIASGKSEHKRTLGTCQDCATVCAAAAQIVARQGPFTDTICKSCAEACTRCGKECDQFRDDRHMKMCADECRRCEKACREMTGHTGALR
jgi:hypothetical protein